MRVLFIKLSSFTALRSSTMRTLSLMKGFYELGWTIDFLTLNRQNGETTNSMDKYSFLSDVNIICLNGQSKMSFDGNEKNKKTNISFTRRILRFFGKMLSPFIVFGSSKKYVKKVNRKLLPATKYDLIISVSDPKSSHLALKKLLDDCVVANKIVEYWGDPLVGDISKSFLIPRKRLKKIEYDMLRISDAIFYTSPFTLDEAKRLYPILAKKMFFTPTANIDTRLLGPTNNKVFTCGYFGAYYSKIRNIKPLYNAFNDFDCNLVIYGDSDLKLEERSNIEVHPRGNIDVAEKKVDLLIMLLNLSGSQIPGKIYHDASTDKPILVILDGENRKGIKEYLTNFERFYFCENDVASIRKAIREIYNNSNRICYPCEKLECRTIAKKIIEI